MTFDRGLVLAREWDDLVARARELGGLADFLRPPSPATVVSAAAGGPVVLLNVSRWGCAALLIRDGTVESLPLPGLTADDVAERVEGYLRAVGGSETQETELGDCLRWMWDAFAGPVLDRLGFRGPPAGGWPRVWWCPTGALTLLPIHAAGNHERPGESVLDRVVSSYTPTVRALLEARAGAAPAAPERMLFVGLAETPGRPRLRNVERERAVLRELLPGDGHVFLRESEATRDAVLDRLADHAWAHFSCHGDQDLDEPSRGGLVLYDGVATVADVGARPYRGEFAFLAGCQTAVGGRALPDEAITLAAALHYAGYRHVIATLWTVRDRTVARVTQDVYGALISDGRLDPRGAARALHDAVRALRSRYPRSPSAWTPFAHTGP
jgi:CHAT domain